jgi:hypothetical protein
MTKKKSQKAKQRDADRQLSGEQQPPSQEEQQKKADVQTEGLTHGEGTQTAGDTGAEGAAASGSGGPDAAPADAASAGSGQIEAKDGEGAGAGVSSASDDDSLTCLACGKPIADDAPTYPDANGTMCAECAPTYVDLLNEDVPFIDMDTGDPLVWEARREIYDAHIAAGGSGTDSMARMPGNIRRETDEERAEREDEEDMRAVTPNVLAAALAASAAFDTDIKEPRLNHGWLRPTGGNSPSAIRRANVAAAFVRDNPEAPDAALPVHLSMKGFGDIAREPGRRVLAAWKVFRATLNALDQVDREDAAEAEREARRKNPDAPSAGFGGDLAMTPSRLPMQPTGFSTVDD